ncbi:RNA polymerase sigma-70 factor [Streptantibioticus rubrisoli]|uniref:RNA polymerase sigma-70 factor n=1 Tax=Streptantibioticus rubrisoli TaxID=1387313 RepID=A0ABT1P6M0_9ACTN|nr:RNA polymerase sigma-70 factor [Streptantibioticus rubrisoli]MCQ4041014.1 RNA polymerase sigma-70 factor [Streptantibioticus rubrisoli]
MSGEQDFAECRSLLFTIAYEILGSAADAEDVVQESYIRWHRASREHIEHPRAYLVRTVTRQALNHLRAARRRREEYVGPWLPEPIRTGPDVSEDAVLAESVSIAMLLVLETLSPDERAVFVLREVFGYLHHEVAEVVGKPEATVRQIAHRAREHVRSRRRRFQHDPRTAEEIVGRFLQAANTGDVTALMGLLAPGVVHISDGGGRVTAARRPVRGREQVARFVAGVARTSEPGARFELASYNALPAVLCRSGDQLDYVLIFEIADTRIHGMYAVRNPDKLGAAVIARPLARRRNETWKP